MEALIEANRVYTPSSRLRQEIEEEARQKRIDKERERERKSKLAADRAEAEKFKSKVSSRNSFNSRLVGYREERTTRMEKQAQFKYDFTESYLFFSSKYTKFPKKKSFVKFFSN